ncbi:MULTISPECIES: ABC transporter ATP-binding protein [Thermococcus]|uniref:Molybdate/tungstate import ATP-binding protein WtpC n=2 Tax=Thermococcus sibiricus TaxID=172049 RepID=C5ZZV7_THESM|nr:MULTISPECIES: betaine/proline/choline family ABC transporter ATP-binding protein [Thermococcus]KUK29156.1 MAG: Osmoprotection protein (ProV) [Thermococcus sp. 40_45]HII66975.1 betaine/proline/choline family ABC transporter ATP-binding protein [Thermococcaceae archaeon]ACS90938.1 Osmoprotection protein (proV) [Thermococcus sibiricus MM 739]KUK18515.1 MAG: Osmoprotection protein (ProV) [Thermococcus sibiricus]MBC7094045.1 betaine/proline/choline family ABC transporter ATP-binding protein [The
MLFNRIENVELRDVTKRYGDFIAVDHVNLEVIGGELLILIGPSGSGKTTLLRTINRLIEPDEGEVFINGQNIRDFDVVELRRSIGYVIQQIGLFPHMTVRDNIGLLLKLEGWVEEEIEERVKELLRLVALPEEFAVRYPHQLSGGQQQRVGLARALALDPPLLLMDEPFGALDPILRKQLQNEFVRIKEALGKTIVFVTHDIEEAFKLGDRISIMKEGRLVQVGYPDELVLNPADEFVAQLVNADKKFKHLDTLRVKDLMIGVENYTVEIKSKEKLLKWMKEKNLEFAVIVENTTLKGVTDLKSLLNSHSIEEALREPIVFSPEDSLASALAEMKSKNAFVGIVVEKEKPVGVLLANEVLLRLL